MEAHLAEMQEKLIQDEQAVRARAEETLKARRDVSPPIPRKPLIAIAAALVAVAGGIFLMMRKDPIADTSPPPTPAIEVAQTSPPTEGSTDPPGTDTEPASTTDVEATPTPTPTTTTVISSTRTLMFPEDTSLGKLSVRKIDEDGAVTWVKKGNARGQVSFPAEEKIRLTINGRAAKELALLENFGASDFYSLELFGESIQDERIQSIKGLTGLRELRIMASDVSFEGLSVLALFPDLQALSLRGTPVDKSVINHITKMNNLEELDLRATTIRDSTATYLVTLTQLKSLQLDEKNVTNVAVLVLTNALPDCDIWPELE